MLDGIDIDLTHAGQDVAHYAGGGVGFLQFISQRPVQMAKPIEATRGHTGSSTDLGKLLIHAIGFLSHPRMAVNGTKYSNVLGLAIQHDAGQVMCGFGPENHRPVNVAAVGHLGTWKDDNATLEVNGGTWQIGTVLCAIPAIQRQQDHRANLRRVGEPHQASGVLDSERFLLSLAGSGLAKHLAEPGAAVDPTLFIGPIPAGTNALDFAGQGMRPKAAINPSAVQIGKVIGGKVGNECASAEGGDHIRAGGFVIVQSTVRQLAIIQVSPSLLGKQINNRANRAIARPLNRAIRAVLDGPCPPMELRKSGIGIADGNVYPSPSIVLAPSAASVWGQWEARKRFYSPWLLCIAVVHGLAYPINIGKTSAHANDKRCFISLGSWVRVPSLLFQSTQQLTSLIVALNRRLAHSHYLRENSGFYGAVLYAQQEDSPC